LEESKKFYREFSLTPLPGFTREEDAWLSDNAAWIIGGSDREARETAAYFVQGGFNIFAR
jgi:hypothetical protein